MTVSVRILATVLVVALAAGACGLRGEVHTAAGESVGGSASAALQTGTQHEVQPDGSILLPDGGTMHVTRHRWGDTLEEVAAQFELTVLVRATDKAWSASMPGSTPKDGWADGEQDLGAMMPGYHWREFEVLEVLSGSYDHQTLSYGNPFERTRAGEAYLLVVSVLTKNEAGEPRYSDQHFTGPAPPYRLTATNILESTDPIAYPELDETLTLSEARARLAD